ncbi:MAG: RidA family protein [Clostridium sp.]
MKTVQTELAPAAIGPYSQGIEANGFLFTSGQIPIVPATGEVVGNTIEKQAKQVFENLQAVLEGGGSNLEQVVKTTCFLADMSDFLVFNKIYEEFFLGKPARSCVAVKALPKNVLCEVEAIAVI